MVNTSSQAASAAMSGATRAPRAASGAVLASVRFQTVTGRPASIRRAAITLPILPVPSQPMLGSVVMRSPRLPGRSGAGKQAGAGHVELVGREPGQQLAAARR